MTSVPYYTANSSPIWRRVWLPKTSSRSLLMLPACLVLSVGLLVPLAYLIAFSFNPSRIGSTTLSATFSLVQYKKLFSDDYYLYVLSRSLSVAVATTAICVVTGYILAFALWRAPKRLRAIGTVIVLAPLLVSIVARTYGWMVILGDRGVINSLLLSMGVIDQPLQMMYTQGAVIVGLVHVFMPFMVLSILASLERINPALDEAALTLGATPLQSARLIFLPLSLPGLSAGITIVFSLSMAAYITPALMGGRGADVLPTLVYQQFVVVYNWHFGSALVVMLLATSLIVVTLLIQALGRRTRAWTVGA